MENNNLIGKRINSALALRDKKQKELAEYLGVKPNVVSYFCNGSRVPNIEQIRKIAEFFNVSSDYLLGLTDIATNDADIKNACEVTGLSEEAINKLYSNFVKTPDPHFIIDEKTMLSNQQTTAEVCSKLICYDEFYTIISCIDEFSYYSEKLVHYIGHLTVSQAIKVAKKLDITTDDIWSIYDSAHPFCDNDYGTGDEYIDSAEYRAIKSLGTIFEKFRHKSLDVDTATREQLLEHFNITESDLENIKLRQEVSDNAKHNPPKE